MLQLFSQVLRLAKESFHREQDVPPGIELVSVRAGIEDALGLPPFVPNAKVASSLREALDCPWVVITFRGCSDLERSELAVWPTRSTNDPTGCRLVVRVDRDNDEVKEFVQRHSSEAIFVADAPWVLSRLIEWTFRVCQRAQIIAVFDVGDDVYPVSETEYQLFRIDVPSATSKDAGGAFERERKRREFRNGFVVDLPVLNMIAGMAERRFTQDELHQPSSLDCAASLLSLCEAYGRSRHDAWEAANARRSELNQLQLELRELIREAERATLADKSSKLANALERARRLGSTLATAVEREPRVGEAAAQAALAVRYHFWHGFMLPTDGAEVIASMRLSFFGHERLMTLLQSRLATISQSEVPDAALMTIVLEGPGGSGKRAFGRALARALYGSDNRYFWYESFRGGTPNNAYVPLLDRCPHTYPYHLSLRNLLNTPHAFPGAVIHVLLVGQAASRTLRELDELRRSPLMRNSVLLVTYSAPQGLETREGGWPTALETLRAEADICFDLKLDHDQLCALAEGQIRKYDRFPEFQGIGCHREVIEHFAREFAEEPRRIYNMRNIEDAMNSAMKTYQGRQMQKGAPKSPLQLAMRDGVVAIIEPEDPNFSAGASEELRG
jgi:thymidylate kinase